MTGGTSAARTSALKYAAQYKPALPDMTYDDIVGSPYAVGAYQVDENFGGRHGLALFRQRLAERGLRLVLDFVPNHVATDHAWIRVHPDYMVLGTPKDLEKRSTDFFSARDATGKAIVVAHGRDPYFPGWIDTAQVNAFSDSAWSHYAQSLRIIGRFALAVPQPSKAVRKLTVAGVAPAGSQAPKRKTS